MHDIIFGISSNADDRETKISEAIEEVTALIPDLKVSQSFTASSYNNIGPEYMSVVAIGQCDIDLKRLHTFVKAFEWQLGRDNNTEPQTGIITIDIDIVTFDGDILKPNDYNQPAFQNALTSLSK